MPQETVVYLVNLIIGAILAGVMSQRWRQEAGGMSLRYWIAAAWMLTAADLFFAIRPFMPLLVMRAVPTAMVTAGHAVLLLAAQHAAGRPVTRRIALTVVIIHAAVLVLSYLVVPSLSEWRAVANGIVWGGLAVAAADALWRSPEHLRRTLFVPAVVLASQGTFHLVRILLAAQAVVEPGHRLSSLVQLLGDLEVSLFMVSLFVSLLVAFLDQANEDLRHALENVRQLSGMLPICAWCNKVRDDDGYWQRIEEYLAEHRVSVTHALCESCAATQFAELEQ